MRDFFSLAKIIAAPGDPSILDMCLQKADKGKGAAEVGVKKNRQSSGFWKLYQKKRMRLNIGSECHLVGEEVAQGGAGASTSFSPLCSEGGLQIQIKDHTNTVHRNYQLTQIHVHTDHTNTQIHVDTDHTNTQKQEVLEGKLHKVVHQPASQLLSTSVQRNCQITQMQIQSSHKYTHYWFTLLMTLLFFSHNIFALGQSHHLPWKSWQRVMLHWLYWLYSIQPPFCDLRQVKVPSMNSLAGEILEQKIQIFLVRRRGRRRNGRWIQEWILASYASPASILAIPPLSSPMLKYFS